MILSPGSSCFQNSTWSSSSPRRGEVLVVGRRCPRAQTSRHASPCASMPADLAPPGPAAAGPGLLVAGTPFVILLGTEPPP